MSDDDLIRRGDALAAVMRVGDAQRIAAIPARGVGAKPCGGCGNDDPLKRCIGCFHDFGTPDSACVLKYAAIAPTDAAHVNETPKTEHDSADVLTEYTLAPHLQKIVDGASTAPQWDTQADRLAPTDGEAK